MKSMVWRGWIAGALRPKSSSEYMHGGPLVEKFVRRENLALLKKRLAESQDETQRKVILKLLAEEEAKGAAVPRKS